MGNDEGGDDTICRDTISCRLILRNRVVPVATLYPMDASPYTSPIATLALEPEQELPRLQPGDVVTARADMTEVDAGGVRLQVIQGASSTDLGQASIFAERGDVIVHPSAVGWRRTWREVRPESVATIDEYEQRIKKNTRSGWWLLGLTVAMITLLIVLILLPGRHGHGPYFFGTGSGSSGAGSWQAWRRARAAKRSLQQARQRDLMPSVAMRMRLWWSVGFGAGPVAIASLWADGDAGSGPVRNVPVIGVPDRFEPPEGTAVMVKGDLHDNHVSTIECGDVTLWPIEGMSDSSARTATLYRGSRLHTGSLAFVGVLVGIVTVVVSAELVATPPDGFSRSDRLLLVTILVPVGLAIVAVSTTYMRVGIAVNGAGVVVKSRLHTHRVAWSAVAGFEIVRSHGVWPGRSTVAVRTSDGTLLRPGTASHRNGSPTLVAARDSLARARTRHMVELAAR